MDKSLSDGKLANDALSAEEFERVAAGCRARWSARTLDVVRVILIDRKTVSAAAAEFGMTPAARTRVEGSDALTPPATPKPQASDRGESRFFA